MFHQLLVLFLLPLTGFIFADTGEDGFLKEEKSLLPSLTSRQTLLDSNTQAISGIPEPLLQLLLFKLTEGGYQPESPISKRVFCNGFTGCGGRHRGRRRYHTEEELKPLGKRLFCNSFSGCSGGKRAESLPDVLLQDSKFKRLFCNYFGGCRGGKRIDGAEAVWSTINDRI